MSAALATLSQKMAAHFGLGEQANVIETLKQTAFKGNVSDAQMTALMIVADQYKLNPFTKEIYAFPDRQNGIVPVVGVDGWSRIINEHPQLDGIDFEQDAESCTCIIYRKDRSRPVRVTEFMDECKRENVGPWKSHPRRMLRHKALIQCSRLAFGFAGIYDQDEAERIIDGGTAQRVEEDTQKSAGRQTLLPEYSEEEFNKNLAVWRAAIESRKRTAEQIIAMVSTKGVLPDWMVEQIKAPAPVDEFTAAYNAAPLENEE